MQLPQVLCIMAAFCFSSALGQIKLERLNIDPSKVSTSGGSSGAAMAMQFHFAHSSEVMGAGIFAGGPYLCGAGGLTSSLACMATPGLVSADSLIKKTDKLASAESIDSPSNLAGSKAFIFHGTKDSVVKPVSSQKIKQMYDHYGAEVKTVLDMPAQHSFPTENYGAPCNLLSPMTAYLNKCNYNGAFEMLNFIYGGNLTRPDNSTEKNGLFSLFDQREFDPLLSGMDNSGFIYIPSACQNGEVCALHIDFHGCTQNRLIVGNEYVKNAGFLEVAELNNIVVLFPQVVSSVVNPAACWDWWGYTNGKFPTKQGKQILAVHRMMDRLM